MNIVTRKRVVEMIRLLEEMAHPLVVYEPGELVKTDIDLKPISPYKDNLSSAQVATLEEAASILKGYLRVLIMLQQFRVAFLAFFTHYPELFGEQDERGPFD